MNDIAKSAALELPAFGALERALQLAEESAMPLEAGLALRHLGREEQAQARWEPHGLIRSPGS